jgi:hypothetical protein
MSLENIIDSVSEQDLKAAADNVQRMASEENHALDGMLMLAYD